MDAQDFHAGELAMRKRAQLDEYALTMSKYYRPFMPEQHLELFERLPFIIVGALDADGQPWASLLEGPPGFVCGLDQRHLRARATLPAIDPLANSIYAGSSIALLGIEPRTRRRNRANGRVDAANDGYIDVHVLQSFGNCPKYIQARTVDYVPGAPLAPAARHIDPRSDVLQRVVSQADTFFIATAHPRVGDGEPQHGVDVSHRGGRPGFVRLSGDTLTVDDYVGNNFFNTLGNLTLLPQAGLLFIDMQVGALLHLAVHTELEWLDAPTPARSRTDRVMHFHIDDALYVTHRSALHWGDDVAFSPFL